MCVCTPWNSVHCRVRTLPCIFARVCVYARYVLFACCLTSRGRPCLGRMSSCSLIGLSHGGGRGGMEWWWWGVAGSTGCFSTWKTNYPPFTSRTATYLSHPPSVSPSPALFSIFWVRLFDHAATVQMLAVIRDCLRGWITRYYYYYYRRAHSGQSEQA